MDEDQDLINRIFFETMYGSFTPEEREALDWIIQACRRTRQASAGGPNGLDPRCDSRRGHAGPLAAILVRR